MGKDYYYRLISDYNAEIDANNRTIVELKEKLGELNPIYDATCEYGVEFSRQHTAQKSKLVDVINGMIGRGRYSNNILNGLGNKMGNAISEASSTSITALVNVEDRIQEEIQIIKEKISSLEIENNQYYGKIEECRREIRRIEEEEAAEEELLNEGGVA